MQRKPQRPASDMHHFMKKTHQRGGATTALCHATETKKRRPHTLCGRRSLRYAMTGRSLDFNLVAQFFLITLLLLWKADSQNTVADVCRYVFSVDIVGQCERLFEL